ncbi:MAG TPA: hypothetical protein VHI77_10750 [Solirubrobacterales bacterium]|jgi:hypothetical protein|nr:hypothetical protein [Solirubrobacterales bacterium]
MSAKQVLAGLGAVAAVAVLAVVLARVLDDNGSAGPASFQARIPPAEYLYLDGARILNYVAQLEGGEVGEVHRISKEIETVSGEASASGFKVGASSQHENEADSTLTRTESSELGLLLGDLRSDRLRGVSMHAVDLDRPASLRRLREGWLVRFSTANLLGPGYIRPYVVVRQSATLAALFPQAAGSEASALRAAEQRRKAESFAHQVGPDPRITFAVVGPHPHGAAALKLLLPMRYGDLTTERSLLEKDRDEYTGGRVVVIGKVIRVFGPDQVECGSGAAGGTEAPGGGEARCEPQPAYTDYATQEIWKGPLEQASNYLIDHVSHSCRTRRSRVELEADPTAGKQIAGRACFLAKLKRQTQLYAPGALILPLAVYK